MSKADELLSLAERVESVKWPDGELDALIAIAIRAGPPLAPWANKFPDWRVGHSFGKPRGEVWSDGELIGHWSSFVTYTASLDAAVSLVPKGWVIGEMSWWPDDNSATCHMDNKHGLKACSGADTLPIAITAAALRARATMEPTT